MDSILFCEKEMTNITALYQILYKILKTQDKILDFVILRIGKKWFVKSKADADEMLI